MSRQVKKVNISDKENKSNKVSNWSNTTTDIHYPSEKLVKDSLDGKANFTHNHTKSQITDFPTIPSKTSELTNDTGFITSSALPTKTSDLVNDGDGSNVFVKDNDSRLLNARTPLAHTHLSSDVTDLVNVIYPVGSIYMSVSNVSPSALFGGTWEQIEDTFLLASGTSYSNGTTGGSADAVVVTHTHTQNPHTHTQDGHSHQPSTTTNRFVTSSESTASNYRVGTASSGRWVDAQTDSGTFFHQLYTDTQTPTINNKTATNNETGESGTGKNMPPYLVVNVWKRTA